MGTFQKTVNGSLAIGVPGAFAAVNPVVSTALGRVAIVDIPVGGFCWDDGAVEGAVKPTGAEQTPPLGFVAREVTNPIFALNEDAEYTYVVPKGCNVSVQVAGDFFVQVPVDVTKGEKVIVDPTTGKIVATAEAEGKTDTGWIYSTTAKANEIAIISKH